MKTSLPLALPLLLFVACGDAGQAPAAPTIVGTWKFSPEWVEKAGGQGTPEQQATARELASKMAMTFGADGTCRTVDSKSRDVTGTYTVAKTEGNVLTVELVIDGKTVEHVYTIDGDRMSQKSGPDTVTFVRS